MAPILNLKSDYWSALALTQRGGSCHRFSFVRPRRQTHVYVGGACAADKEKSAPPARGWLRRQRKCGGALPRLSIETVDYRLYDQRLAPFDQCLAPCDSRLAPVDLLPGLPVR